MAIINSNAVVITINSETAICPKSASLKMDLELKDLQCSAANGWKRSAAGNKSWEVSGNFIADSATGMSMGDLTTVWNTAAVTTVSVAVTGGVTATGSAFLTNLTFNFPENADPVEVSYTLTGDNALTFS